MSARSTESERPMTEKPEQGVVSDKWIKHDGGGCPCDPTDAVEIMTRGGDISRWERASSVVWPWDAYIAETHSPIPYCAQVTLWRPIEITPHAPKRNDVMTQDKETLREAVARAIAETEGFDPAMDHIEGWYETADAAIATMFERLRTPSEGMMEAGGRSEGVILDDFDGVEIFPKRIWQAMLAAFQQENSDA